MFRNFNVTVGRPFRVAIPSACSDSCKAKALALHIKQIKVAVGLIQYPFIPPETNSG